MFNIARKTLEIYLTEKRLASQNEMNSEDLAFLSEKKAIFVTLSQNWKVIASAGRIQPIKENSLAECMDITLHCLKDSRFSANLQTPESLTALEIRIDSFANTDRKILANISDLNINEGLIFLSQKFGKMSVILPNMIKNNPTPEKFLEIAKQKAGVATDIDRSDYVIYSFTATTFKNL